MSADATPPSPTPSGALVATLAATCITWASFLILLPVAGATLGLAVGATLGLGGMAALLVRTVEPPGDFGLRGLRPAIALVIALAAPAVVVTSEIDNWVAEILPRPEALEQASAKTGPPTPADAGAPDPDAIDAEPSLPSADGGTASETDEDVPLGALAALEVLLFAALLRPVLEEFFFRGVIHQGLAPVLGTLRTVFATALLFATLRASFGLGDPYAMTTLGAQALVEGLFLGGLRVATGSIFAGVAYQAATQTLGLVAVSFAGAMPLAGFNAEGAHTPFAIVLACALSAGFGLRLAFRVGAAPLPEPKADVD